jgi:hypothetical protein
MMMILCHTRQIRMISEYEIGPFMTTFVFWFAASVLLLVQELHYHQAPGCLTVPS